jgi:phospholipase/carboxylesterase
MNNIEPQVDRALEARVNLYYDLRPGTISPAPLLIALHGYGANKSYMMREAQLMAPQQFAIAALQGFHQHIKVPRETGGPLRFGFGWLTNFRSEESVAVHHRALLDLIEILSEEGIADPARVFLLGFSQSCALNYRFAFTHPDRLRGVVGMCGGIPGDWETSSAYHDAEIHVLHLAGTRDEFYPPERVRDYERQLKTRARSVEFKSYDAAHEIIPEMRGDVVQWLQDVNPVQKLTKTINEH